MEIISAQQAREKSIANKPKITPEAQDKDLSSLTYVMRMIKNATDKGETEIELFNKPYNIKSNLNKEKRILVNVCSYILDEDKETQKSFNSQTHKTLKQNGFKISKEPYKKLPMDGSLFVVKISW